MKNKIHKLLLSNYGMDEIGGLSDPYISVESRGVTSFVVIDPEPAKEILISDSFQEYKYSNIFGQILASLKSDSQGLIRFFSNSPLEQGARTETHDVLRHEYKKIYDRVLSYEPEHPEISSKRIFTKDYVDLYMDSYFRRAFRDLLGSDACYEEITASKGIDVFDIFSNPSRILSVSKELDGFYEQYPHDDLSLDKEIRENPEAFLTMLLMGRDPLTVTMACWLNSILSGENPDSKDFRAVSATNFIPRICTRDTVIGGINFKEGQLAYLLLAGANRSEKLKSRIGLAFGYGAHFCLGYQFADKIFRKFKADFDYSHTDMMLPSKRVIRNAFSEFVKEDL
ncbi:hypothetical protein J2T55_002433 [Methylohalomonas lacus]|uniref:Cytochrome P450 n=1 Tax=Methylohalomonas lacus TaxID=398773 RepID=A0AAE3HP45_9GAMM|nr:hypothetical protein [Methylohalomonas lacus]MCS3904397.1 hypothetical protein [Methylohalomonas lacus]